MRVVVRLLLVLFSFFTFVGSAAAQQVTPFAPLVWLEYPSSNIEVHWRDLCPVGVGGPVCMWPYFPGTTYIYRVDPAIVNQGELIFWCAWTLGNVMDNPPRGVQRIWGGGQSFGAQAMTDYGVAQNRYYGYIGRSRQFTGLWQQDSVCSFMASGMTCSGGRRFNGSSCVCPGNTVWSGTQCMNPPRTTVEVNNAAVCDGGTAGFQFGVSGDSVSYQWSRNGSIIPGATSNAYSRVVHVADSGSGFSCRASNSVGSVQSRTGSLTVFGAPATQISAQPGTPTVTSGSTVTLTATPQPPNNCTPTYQWFKTAPNQARVQLPNTSQALSVQNVTPAMNGTVFTCRATVGTSFTESNFNFPTVVCPIGSAWSASLNRCIYPPQYSGSELVGDFCDGDHVQLLSGASGDEMQYEWIRQRGANAQESVVIPNASAATYEYTTRFAHAAQFPDLFAAHAGLVTFLSRVSNPAGTRSWEVGRLNIWGAPQPEIVSTPSRILQQGTSATLSCNARSINRPHPSCAMTRTWYKALPDQSTSIIEGQSGETLTLSSEEVTAALNGARFICRITVGSDYQESELSLSVLNTTPSPVYLRE